MAIRSIVGLGLILVVGSRGISAQESGPNQSVGALFEYERTIARNVAAGSMAFLDSVYPADFRFTHGDGRVDTVGFGVHPLSIAAQADLGRLSVTPFLSLGPVQPLVEWAQSQSDGSSRVWKGALIGAGIGGGLALVTMEIFRYCDPADNSATYTCTINYGRVALLGAGAGAVGAVIGAAIAKFTGSSGSSQDWSPVPRLGTSLDGGWALSISIPSGVW